METLADLVATGRTRDATAFEIESRVAPYSYEKCCTNAWKAANLLSHYGVASLGELSVVIGPKEGESGAERGPGTPSEGVVDSPEPLLALLGGTLLGATVDMTPPAAIETKTVVHPAGWAEAYDLPPGCTQLAYGGPPEDPSVVHFEREAWSENPIEPPESVGPADTAVRANGDSYSHSQLLDASQHVVEEFSLTEGDSVLLATRLTDAKTLVAGVLAPMSVGATIVIPEAMVADSETARDATLVVTGDGLEDVATPVYSPEAVSL